jgi:RNA polymerase sigma-70 factor (ECF subfamily)
MALPFDLRSCAPIDDLPDDDIGRRHDSVKRVARPSRAIVLPATLVEGVRARDVEAFRELVRLAYVPLVRFATTVVGARDVAEDVVQETLTVVWDRGESWNPSGDAVAYLFTSVRNRALNELRRIQREARRARVAQEREQADISSAEDETALDATIRIESQTERLTLVAQVLATLTERQRTAYDLRYRRGLPAPAIAEILDITVKSAEQLVSRVTHLVWDRLEKMVPPNS